MSGLLICLIIGAGIIGAFYGLGADHWGPTEAIWEGVFALVSSIIIAVMGAALLRVSKMQAKWRVKLARALEAKDNREARFDARFRNWAEKYAMFILPFITILREGLEAVAFISGISLSLPATSIPLATVVGLIAGFAASYLIYRCGNAAPLQLFLIVSTCFLYLVAAGLFSRSIWYFEADAWNKLTGGDAAENGSGPGSYDIRKSVWHVNCCNPELNGGGGWGIFNAIFGWQNSATYGSVIGYNMFWIAVIVAFVLMRYNEKKGHWPFMKAKSVQTGTARQKSESDVSSEEHALGTNKRLAQVGKVTEV